MLLTSTPSTQSLLITFIIDAGLQFIFYVISAILKTEKFYDFSGALTYITITAVLLGVANQITPLGHHQVILAIFVFLWSARLGIFLFLRVLKHKDSRFDALKQDPIKFAIPWAAQVLWIFVTPLPMYIVLGNNAKAWMWSDYIGIIIWVFGFVVEALADYQKQVFKTKYPQDFITTGVWAYSRCKKFLLILDANYFGEVTLWYGFCILAFGAIQDPWQWVMVISPVFVNVLLVFGSGVALSETNAQKRYGSRQDFQDYCARTSKFFLLPPKKGAVSQSPVTNAIVDNSS